MTAVWAVIETEPEGGVTVLAIYKTEEAAKQHAVAYSDACGPVSIEVREFTLLDTFTMPSQEGKMSR